jgi:dephospho-CoA kinase
MKIHSSVLRLGLTGGIGSGKSTVAAMLARRGAAIVDADAISRSLTLPGGAAMPDIAQAFGSEVVASDGALDRDAMRQRVFADPQIRARLERIIHPLVALETARQAEAAVAAGVSCVVFDVPLLVESGSWRSRVDAVLVVDCSPAVQIQRVMYRSGWTQDAVERVISSQAPRGKRLTAADVCLCNEGISLEDLDAMVGQIWKYFGL